MFIYYSTILQTDNPETRTKLVCVLMEVVIKHKLLDFSMYTIFWTDVLNFENDFELFGPQVKTC